MIGGSRMLKQEGYDLMGAAFEVYNELKAVKALASGHRAQLFNYMRIAKKRVGYLINFGTPEELEWERIIISGEEGRTTNRR